MTNITNATQILEDYTYNITSIMSDDVILEPATWLSNYNVLLNGWPIVIFLVVFAISLFVLMRKVEATTDSESAVYAGLMTSFIGVMLFLIKIDGVTKLLTWTQLLPFIVVTFIAIIVNYVNKRF